VVEAEAEAEEEVAGKEEVVVVGGEVVVRVEAEVGVEDGSANLWATGGKLRRFLEQAKAKLQVVQQT
jgi:hypothetical protein